MRIIPWGVYNRCMQVIFNKGDRVRAKRGLLQKMLPFLSKTLTVLDVHELQYHGENFKSVGVSVRDESGSEFHFPQDNLEKI